MFSPKLLEFIDVHNKKFNLNATSKNVQEFYDNLNIFLSAKNKKYINYLQNLVYKSFHNIIYGLPNDKFTTGTTEKNYTASKIAIKY